MAEEKLRYSEEELQEFKQLILAKLAEAQAQYDNLRSNIVATSGNDTSDTSRSFKTFEDASTMLGKEETAHLCERQRKFIGHLQAALVRIENGTYGICRATGKLIPKERLRAVPHATLSIDAKQG